MIHAFRLGPVASPGGVPRYAYVGVVEGGEPRLHEAPSDRGGLEVLKGGAVGETISCEPALADAGKGLGLPSAPLPPGVLRTRALIAYEYASGVQHGASKPDALAAFLAGAAAFWAARSWEVVAPEERLRVEFLAGHAEVDGELSVVGGDGMRLPGVALCDARASLEELARLEGDARAEAALRLANLTVDMERDPAWAVEAIEEGYGLPRLPVASRRRGTTVARMVTQDLLVAAALLQAVAAWAGLDEEGAVGEGAAEAAGMRVVARVRRSGDLAPAPSGGGLTLVAAGKAAPAPTAEPAPRAPAPVPAPPEPAAVVAAPEGAEVTARGSTGSPRADSSGAARAEAEPIAAAPPPAPPEPIAPTSPPPAAVAPAAAPSPPPDPAAAEPSPAPEPSGPGPAEAEAQPGWLARAWRALRGGGAPAEPESARAGAPGPAAKPAPAAAPPRSSRSPRRPASPGAGGRPAGPAAARPPAPEVDDADPFAPFARALRIAIPAEPPALSPGDEAALVELSGRVLGAAASSTGAFVSFPAVALEILERVQDPRADARGVAGFIARDPALAADVVSVANSAAYRGASEIESVHEAVARLGLTEVGRVASAVAARKLLAPSGPGAPGGAGADLFVRAVAVATVSAGAALRQRGARSDHAWLGGLLHDVGRALAGQILARLSAEPGATLTPIAVGARLVELVHVEVGAAALRQWGLPAYLQEICGHHHDPIVPAVAVDLHLVRLASALASLGEPLVAARAAREILQSAAALGLNALAVRALGADLAAAEGRARALVR